MENETGKTSGFDRRRFLGAGAGALGVGVGAFGAALPTSLARGFASSGAGQRYGTPPEGPVGWELLKQALRKAQEAGKPLLVLDVPTDPSARMERGRLWGQYFANAQAEGLALFALVEVACIEQAVLAKRFAACAEADPALAWLVETDSPVTGETRPAAWRPELREIEPSVLHFPNAEVDANALVRERVGEMARALQRFLMPDEAAVERRAEQAKAKIEDLMFPGDGVPALFEMLGSDARPRLSQLDAAAAFVWREISKFDEGAADRARWTRCLADAAARRLWDDAPSGSRWHTATNYCPTCGMGFTPESSRHFLEFFVDPDAEDR